MQYIVICKISNNHIYFNHINGLLWEQAYKKHPNSFDNDNKCLAIIYNCKCILTIDNKQAGV